MEGMAGKRKRQSDEFKMLVEEQQKRLEDWEQWEKHEKRLEEQFKKYEKLLDDHQNQLNELRADLRSFRRLQVAVLPDARFGLGMSICGATSRL